MKSHCTVASVFPGATLSSARLLGFALPVVLGFLAPTAALSAPPAAGAPAEGKTKPYTLFMGANVSVEWQGQVRPIRGVEAGNFVIDVDGRRVVVPADSRNLRIKLDDSLMVAPNAITVAGFKAERAYTSDNDPNRHYSRAGSNALDASAMVDLQNKQLNQLNAQIGIVGAETSSGLGGPGPEVVAGLQQQAGQVDADMQHNLGSAGNAINTIGDAGSRAAIEAAQEKFDALRLSFDISSRDPVKNPYVVVVMRFREDADLPNSTRQLVYAQKLNPVGDKAQSVRLFRAGLPPGYKLEDLQLHVYDSGTELATNVARKAVPLSADEAFQFSVVNYVEQHRAASLDPVAAEIASPAHVRSRVAPDKLGRVYYVKVAKSGMPAGVFADPSCTETIADADLAGALSTLRFYPALKNGKPIESVTPVRL